MMPTPMTRRPLSTPLAAALLGLTPTLASAHGGHGELGASHSLWHALPWVALSVLALALVGRAVWMRGR